MSVIPLVEPQRAYLSYSKLKWVYAIIPLSILMILVDVLFLNRYLQKTLPLRPESLVWFALVFELPHIFASAILLADVEYIRFYGKKIILGLVILAMSLFVLPLFIPFRVIFALVGVFTIYHVIGQQLGINGALLRKKGRLFNTWKVCCIIIGSLLFWGALMQKSSFGDYFWIIQTLPALLFIYALYLGKHLKAGGVPKIGLDYMRLNHLMILSALIFFWIGYPFFVLLIPRVVHDLTAFAYYITHDKNRNSLKCKNIIHIPFRKLGIPIYLITPLLAIIMGVAFRHVLHADYHRMVWIYYFLSAFHFFTEAFSWKSGTPHRAHIFLKT
jgi:hypothetical protein